MVKGDAMIKESRIQEELKKIRLDVREDTPPHFKNSDKKASRMNLSDVKGMDKAFATLVKCLR